MEKTGQEKNVHNTEKKTDKKCWVTPDIRDVDMVEITKSGPWTPLATMDSTFGYS